MKKILALSIVLSVMVGTSAFAATTYTESFIQKHTQKITDAEKKLQQQQKANQEALEKKQKEREAAKAETQKKIEKKKQLWNQLISE